VINSGFGIKENRRSKNVKNKGKKNKHKYLWKLRLDQDTLHKGIERLIIIFELSID
jgi:hypothetical protein